MRYVLTLFILVVLVACQDAAKFPGVNYNAPTDAELDRLITTANQEDRRRLGEALASFKTEGSLETYTGFDSDQQTPFIRIFLTEEAERTAVFEMVLDEPIDFPALIEQARIVYLRNQLMIHNRGTGEIMHFYVDNGVRPNLIPAVPMTDVVSLAIIRGEQARMANLTESTCSCSCKKCWSPNDCGSASASCSCNGNMQSIDCRQNYNAQCTQCSGGNQ